MDGSDREIAEGLHQLVRRVTPDLVPRTWYCFPAYAKDGKVVLFWQFAGKFKTRYGPPRTPTALGSSSTASGRVG